jgi:hypothetical protein
LTELFAMAVRVAGEGQSCPFFLMFLIRKYLLVSLVPIDVMLKPICRPNCLRSEQCLFSIQSDSLDRSDKRGTGVYGEGLRMLTKQDSQCVLVVIRGRWVILVRKTLVHTNTGMKENLGSCPSSNDLCARSSCRSIERTKPRMLCFQP